MKITIFVFEDYGIAIFQHGENVKEDTKTIEALKKKSVASYELILNENTNAQKINVA